MKLKKIAVVCLAGFGHCRGRACCFDAGLCCSRRRARVGSQSPAVGIEGTVRTTRRTERRIIRPISRPAKTRSRPTPARIRRPGRTSRRLGQRHAQYRPFGRRHVLRQHAEQPCSARGIWAYGLTSSVSCSISSCCWSSYPLISHLWRKFRGKKNSSDDDAYRRGYEAAMREERFRHKGMTIDVKPIDDDKDDRRR